MTAHDYHERLIQKLADLSAKDAMLSKESETHGDKMRAEFYARCAKEVALVRSYVETFSPALVSQYAPKSKS